MNMPRFTAENSLYESSINYSMALSYTQIKDSINVIPQQQTITECSFCNPYTNMQSCRRKAMVCRIEKEPFSLPFEETISGPSVLQPPTINCQWETIDMWLQACGEFDPFPPLPHKLLKRMH
jgi:hypothetical protein